MRRAKDPGKQLGGEEFTFATATNGKQCSAPKTRLLIQSWLPQNRFTKEEARKDNANRPIRMLAPVTLLAIERDVWEAWKDHDAKQLTDLTAANISFINIFGIYLPTKAEGLKNWSGTGCEVKRVGVADAAGTMLSPEVGILTFKATADGTASVRKLDLFGAHQST